MFCQLTWTDTFHLLRVLTFAAFMNDHNLFSAVTAINPSKSPDNNSTTAVKSQPQ